MRVFISLLSAALLLASCVNSGTGQAPPRTVGQVDLTRYQGVWYELARLPSDFQSGCLESQVKFTLRPDGGLDVLSRCRGRRGVWTQVEGAVQPQEKGSTDKFQGNFNGGLLGGLSKEAYWTLFLDSEYSTAIVGDPKRNHLWLLARQPEVKKERLDKMLLLARKQGYDVRQLIWRKPSK